MKKTILFSLSFLASVSAFAEEAATAVATTATTAAAGTVNNAAFFAIAAGLAIGMAALGGAIGQGRIGATAMDGIARNPQARKEMFAPMIVGLALIESLVIYALVIAFQVVGKI